MADFFVDYLTLPPDYIDSAYTGRDRELLEAFYVACQAEGGSVDEITLRGIQAAIAADRAARPEPAAPPAELLCELFAFAVVCNDKLKGDGLWDEEEDYSEGLFDRVRAEIERQQSAPAAPPSSPHTPPGPAAAPSPAGSTDEAPGSPQQPPQPLPSDDMTDALRYFCRFVDVARMQRHLEALERIQYTGEEEAGDSEGHS